VLTEIMFIAEKFYQGFIYGFAFGVGTVISPLLLLGMVAPLLPARLPWMEKLCGILLIGIGFYLILK